MKFILNSNDVSGEGKIVIHRPEYRNVPFPYVVEIDGELAALSHDGVISLIGALLECVAGKPHYSVELYDSEQYPRSPQSLNNEELVRKLVPHDAPKRFVNELKQRLGMKI